MTKTTALCVRVRRAQATLNARSASPIRVPPDQSETFLEIFKTASSSNPPPRPAHTRLPIQFVQHCFCLSQLVLGKLGEVFCPRDLAGTVTHGCDALDNLRKRARCRIVSSLRRFSGWEIDFRLA